MIKTKKLVLTLTTAFLMMFAVAMVSADVAYTSVVGSAQTVDPNSQVTITFNLKEDGTGAITNLAFDTPFTLSGCSSLNLIVTPTISGVPSQLAEGATSGTVTVTFTVPQNQAPCDSYTGNLILKGKYTTDVVPVSHGSLPLSIKVNAKPSLEVSTPTTLTQSQDSTFTIKNTGNVPLTPDVNVDALNYNSKTLTFTVEGEGVLQPGASQTITIKTTLPTDDSLLAGKSTTARITAPPQITTEITRTISVEASYCSVGNIGELEIDKLDFTNLGKYGDDDEWYLLSDIEAEVRVENTGEEDIDDIIVKWGLYDKDSGKFLFDDEEKNFDLDDDERETLTIKFVLDPDEFDENFNEGDFVFFVKAYSDDLGESKQCASEKDSTIRIKKDKDLVVLDNIILTSDSIPCNQFLEGKFNIWNIGNNEEEDVSVIIFNEELKISETVKIGDLDILEDKKSVPFSVKIPANAVEKSYVLNFRTIDDDGDPFESDEDEISEFSSSFAVAGQCAGVVTGLEITADYDPDTPEAVAGKQVIIKATLRNKGDKEVTYTVSVEGNSAWSSLSAIDPAQVTIPAGQSKDVNLILSVNKDASGDKDFTIKATSEGKTTEKIVRVPISSVPTQQVDIAEHLRQNWFIYLIILVNIILIIAIIVVIRRMVSPAPM